ncbi:hypothetical protein ACQKJG_18350 [Priestia megaterium]|uniref:hypothetical protein n=1 Tax=Priestia megaterium TaxID=1404 RepID=UPI003CFF9274
MAEEKLCELYIINLITNNRRVGNVILEPKEKQFVSFYSLSDIKYAIKLHNRREISIETELPEEVMQMLEEDPHIPDTTIPKPPVSIALVYQNEFKKYKEDVSNEIEDLSKKSTDALKLQMQQIQNKGIQDSLLSVNKSKAKYDDTANTIFTEGWNNLNNWTLAGTPGLQISANKVYSTGTGGPSSGANKAFAINDNENLRAVFKVTIPSGAISGGIIIGVSQDAAGAVPTGGAGKSFGIYFRDPSVPVQVMDNGTVTTAAENVPASPGDYTVTVTVDQKFISVVATKVDGSIEIGARRLRAGFAVNNLYILNSDTRALTGASIGVMSARKGLQTINPRNYGEGFKTVQWTGDGTQSFRFYLPSDYDSRVPSPVVICFHGNGSDEIGWSTNGNMAAMQRALVNAGFIVVTCTLNASKTTWGNAASTNAYYEAYKYLKNNYAIGPVAFYANSMGGVESLNALAENKIPCVAWVATVPTFNLKNCYDTAMFTSVIKAAYGISADGSDYNQKTAGRDPALMSPSAFRLVPMMILAPSDDAAVSTVENADALQRKVQGYALELVRVPVASGGHSFSINSYTQQMVDFFKKYAF